MKLARRACAARRQGHCIPLAQVAVSHLSTSGTRFVQVAIVTGASSGVGAALSRRLAERGCGVVGVPSAQRLGFVPFYPHPTQALTTKVVNFSKSADDAAKVAEAR